MSWSIRAICLGVLAISGIMLLWSDNERPTSSVAPAQMSVWFMPAANSSDITELFTLPADWAETRKSIDAFVLSPAQVQPLSPEHRLGIPDLGAVDAFRKLGTLGLKTALQVPALKEWDCAARRTGAVTIDLMKAVYRHGGSIQFLEMDEPLVSALGLNSPVCKLDIATAAAEVAAYTRSVTTDPDVVQSGTIPRIVDIEAYPSLTVRQIETWITALEVQGFHPDAFHIDVNLQYIDRTPAAQATLAGDLQRLQKFLHIRRIVFGIIIWSGHDPEKSDQDYYDHAMKWVWAIYEAIGRPDRVSFESWVKRCTRTGNCSDTNLGCSSADPVDCGTISVPRNLPEDDPTVFSHMRLIRDALLVLNRR